MTRRTREFSHRSLIQAPASSVWEFHANPRALQILTPPPIFVTINDDERTGLTEGRVDFMLWFGPIPIRWVAQHEPGSSPDSFRDRMIQGPMELWVHEHVIYPQGESTILEDRLVYAFPSGMRGVVSGLLFNPISLRLLFIYRHFRTRLGVRKSATSGRRNTS